MTYPLPHGLPGLFVAFEGGDGAGKSTQASLLCRALEESGRTVVRTREPGGTPIGEELRSLVLEHGHGDIDARTEALMFAASRAAHVQQVIVPALGRGDVKAWAAAQPEFRPYATMDQSDVDDCKDKGIVNL